MPVTTTDLDDARPDGGAAAARLLERVGGRVELGLGDAERDRVGEGVNDRVCDVAVVLLALVAHLDLGHDPVEAVGNVRDLRA